MSDTYEEGEPGLLSVEMGLTTEWVPVIVHSKVYLLQELVEG
jgi:hypothetical protein